MVDPSKGIMKPMSAAEKITAMSPTEKNFPVVVNEYDTAALSGDYDSTNFVLGGSVSGRITPRMENYSR